MNTNSLSITEKNTEISNRITPFFRIPVLTLCEEHTFENILDLKKKQKRVWDLFTFMHSDFHETRKVSLY